MKTEALNHSKMKRLGRKLGSIVMARGIMESLWHMTKREAPRGDIGRKTNEEISDGIDYDGDIGQLIEWLVECRWLDRSDTHRLIVHDWHEHAEDAVHMSLARRGLRFASGATPKMGRLSADERAKCTANYTKEAEAAHTETYAKHTPIAQEGAVCTPPSPPLPSLPKTQFPKTQNAGARDPAGSLSDVVERHIATSMNLSPAALRPHRNEPQQVVAKIEEWRQKWPFFTIAEHVVPCDEVIARAAAKCEEAKLHGSRVNNCLTWIDSVLDGCFRGGVWPGEFRESSAAPLKAATVTAKPHQYVPKEQRL